MLGGVFLCPEEVFALVVNAEAPSETTSTHQRKLGLGGTILGGEVRGFENRILGDLRNLVELEFGDLGGGEGEEDEERGEVLHGGGGGKAVRLRRGTTGSKRNEREAGDARLAAIPK